MDAKPFWAALYSRRSSRTWNPAYVVSAARFKRASESATLSWSCF